MNTTLLYPISYLCISSGRPIFCLKRILQKNYGKNTPENGPFLMSRVTFTVYKHRHTEDFLALIRNTGFKLSRKKLKLMYTLNLEESSPNKKQRAAFLPNYFCDSQDDVLIFSETCILKLACSFYPLLFFWGGDFFYLLQTHYITFSKRN